MIYRLWKCCSQDKGGPCVLYPVRSMWDPTLSGVAQWTGLLLWRPSKAFISGYDSERHFSGKSYQLCRNYNPPPPKESKCLKKILTHFFSPPVPEKGPIYLHSVVPLMGAAGALGDPSFCFYVSGRMDVLGRDLLLLHHTHNSWLWWLCCR